ncbi:hypothetical protein L7F22_012704 [Adiantum nelumboides]|nr:hypothetical protein [Adiantum nelumboides]
MPAGNFRSPRPLMPHARGKAHPSPILPLEAINTRKQASRKGPSHSENPRNEQGFDWGFSVPDEHRNMQFPKDPIHGSFAEAQEEFNRDSYHNTNQEHNDKDDDTEMESVTINDNELEAWFSQLRERVVIGLCHGPRPSMEVLKQWIAVNWENRNVFPQHIQNLPNNFYVFFYEDANSALQVITEGQWLIRNTLVSFFKSFKGFNPKGEKPTKIPVWVDFPYLPVEFYPWLNKIGNVVGKVLGQKARGGINPKWDPQLLIEVDTSKPTKTSVPIRNNVGQLIHDQSYYTGTFLTPASIVSNRGI